MQGHPHPSVSLGTSIERAQRCARGLRVILAAFLVLVAWGQRPAQAAPSDPQAAAYRGPLAPAAGRSLVTRWPVLLSHPFGNDTTRSFRGDQADARGQFDPFGVQRALERRGAVVYQPDKVAFGSHEVRGRLLYKKCAGLTLTEMLCEGPQPVVVDGLHLAMARHCAHPGLRSQQGFDSEAACLKGLQFNIICHSQGCVDSRYMMVALRNEHSGLPMHRHVASWSSLAGANKGTAQVDLYLDLTAACLSDACRAGVFDALLTLQSWRIDRKLVTDGGNAMINLSQRYMLDSTDVRCKPTRGRSCPPSFNERHRFPEDPEHPILYQSFSITINDPRHPCHSKHQLIWRYLMAKEGPNDGNISVESQRFTTYGRNGTGGATPVVARPLSATSLDPKRPHPGMYHMAFSDYLIAGMDGGRASCRGEDNSAFRFSRIGVYEDLVAELATRGY